LSSFADSFKGEDITIYGDGRQSRSFCYVDDLIAGFIRLMASPDELIGPINLGKPIEFTMLELAQKVTGLTGSKSKITFKTLPEDDPWQRKPNISLAETKLDWQPRGRPGRGSEKYHRLLR